MFRRPRLQPRRSHSGPFSFADLSVSQTSGWKLRAPVLPTSASDLCASDLDFSLGLRRAYHASFGGITLGARHTCLAELNWDHGSHHFGTRWQRRTRRNNIENHCNRGGNCCHRVDVAAISSSALALRYTAVAPTCRPAATPMSSSSSTALASCPPILSVLTDLKSVARWSRCCEGEAEVCSWCCSSGGSSLPYYLCRRILAPWDSLQHGLCARCSSFWLILAAWDSLQRGIPWVWHAVPSVRPDSLVSWIWMSDSCLGVDPVTHFRSHRPKGDHRDALRGR